MSRWSRAQSEIQALVEENNALREQHRWDEERIERVEAQRDSMIEQLNEAAAHLRWAAEQSGTTAEAVVRDREALADWLIHTRTRNVREKTRQMIYRVAEEIRTGQFTDGEN